MPKTCAFFVELISAAADREVTAAERAALDAHLESCAVCRNRLDRHDEMRRRTLLGPAPALDDLVGRIAVRARTVARHRAGRPRRVATIAAAAIVVVASCCAALTVSTRHPVNGQATVADATDRVVTVRLIDQQPSVRHVTIHRGDQVRWVNTDLERHQLVIHSGGARIEGDLARRSSETVTYTTVGTYSFDCVLHPSLSGTVTVL